MSSNVAGASGTRSVLRISADVLDRVGHPYIWPSYGRASMATGSNPSATPLRSSGSTTPLLTSVPRPVVGADDDVGPVTAGRGEAVPLA